LVGSGLVRCLTFVVSVLVITSLVVPVVHVLGSDLSSDYLVWFSKRSLSDYVLIQAFRFRRWPDRLGPNPLVERYRNPWSGTYSGYEGVINYLISLYYFKGIVPKYEVVPPLLKRVRELMPYYPLYGIYEPLKDGEVLRDGDVITVPKGESVIIALGPKLVLNYVNKFLRGATFEAEVTHPLSNYSLLGEVRKYSLSQYAALVPLYLSSKVNYYLYLTLLNSNFMRVHKELPNLPPSLNPFSRSSSIVITYEIIGNDGAAWVFIGAPSKYVPTSYFRRAEELARNEVRGLRLASTVPVIQPTQYFIAGNEALREGSKGVLVVREDVLSSNYLIVTINPRKYSGTFKIRFKAYIVPRGREFVIREFIRYGLRKDEVMKYPKLREFTLTFKVGPEYWRILEGSRGASIRSSKADGVEVSNSLTKAEIVGYGYFGEAILRVTEYRDSKHSYSSQVLYQSIFGSGVYRVYRSRDVLRIKSVAYFPLGGATPLPSGAPIIMESPKVTKYVAVKSFYSYYDIISYKYSVFTDPCGNSAWLDKWMHPLCKYAYEIMGETNLWLTYPLYQYRYYIVELTRMANDNLRSFGSHCFIKFPCLMYGNFMSLFDRLKLAPIPSSVIGELDYRVPPSWWGVLGVNEANDFIYDVGIDAYYSVYDTYLKARILFSVLDLSRFGKVRVTYFGKYDKYVVSVRTSLGFTRYVSPPPTYLQGINELTLGGIVSGTLAGTYYVAGKFIKREVRMEVPNFTIKSMYIVTNKVYYSLGDEVTAYIHLLKGKEPLMSNSIRVVVTLNHRYLSKPKVILTKRLSTDSSGTAKLVFKLPTYEEFSRELREGGSSKLPPIIKLEIIAYDDVNKLDYVAERWVLMGVVFIELMDVKSVISPNVNSNYPLIEFRDRYSAKSFSDLRSLWLIDSRNSNKLVVELNIYDRVTGELVKNLRLSSPFAVIKLPMGDYSAEVIVRINDLSDAYVLKTQLYNFTIDETITMGAAPVVEIDVPVTLVMNALEVESQLEKLQYVDATLLNSVISSIKNVLNKGVSKSADFLDELVVISKAVSRVCSELGGYVGSRCSKLANYLVSTYSAPSNYLSKLILVKTPIKVRLIREYLGPYITGSKRLPRYGRDSLSNPDSFWSRLVRATLVEAVVINRYYRSVKLIHSSVYYVNDLLWDVIDVTKLGELISEMRRASSPDVIDVKALEEDLLKGSGPFMNYLKELKSLGGYSVFDKLNEELVKDVGDLRNDIVNVVVNTFISQSIKSLVSNVMIGKVLSKAMNLTSSDLSYLDTELTNELTKLATPLTHLALSRVGVTKKLLGYDAVPPDKVFSTDLRGALGAVLDEAMKLGTKLVAHYVAEEYIVNELVPKLKEFLKYSVGSILHRHNAGSTRVIIDYVSTLTSFVGDVDGSMDDLMSTYSLATNPLGALTKHLSFISSYELKGYKALESSRALLELIEASKSPVVSPYRGTELEPLISKVYSKVIDGLGSRSFASKKLSWLVKNLKEVFGEAGEGFRRATSQLMIIYLLKISVEGFLAYSTWTAGTLGTELVLKSLHYEVKGVPVVRADEVAQAYAGIFKYFLNIAPGWTLSIQSQISMSGSKYSVSDLSTSYVVSNSPRIKDLSTLVSSVGVNSFSTRFARLKELISKLVSSNYLMGRDLIEALNLTDSTYHDLGIVIKALGSGLISREGVGINELVNLLSTYYVLRLVRDSILQLYASPIITLNRSELTILMNALMRSSNTLDDLMSRLVSGLGSDEAVVFVDAYVSKAGIHGLNSTLRLLVTTYSGGTHELVIRFRPLRNVVRLGRDEVRLKLGNGLRRYGVTNYVIMKNPVRYGLVEVKAFLDGRLVSYSVVRTEAISDFKKLVVGNLIINYLVSMPKVVIKDGAIRLSNLTSKDYVVIYLPKVGSGAKPELVCSGNYTSVIIDLGRYYVIKVTYDSVGSLVIKYSLKHESYIANLGEGKVIYEGSGEVLQHSKVLSREVVSKSVGTTTGTYGTPLSSSRGEGLASGEVLSTSSVAKAKAGASPLGYVVVTYVLVTTLVAAFVTYLIIRRRGGGG